MPLSYASNTFPSPAILFVPPFSLFVRDFTNINIEPCRNNCSSDLCQVFVPIISVCSVDRMLESFNKVEIRNRFNLISEERVKRIEQNSENLMKIGWKIRKLWHFEVSQIFTKHFRKHRYEYGNEWVDDVIASLLAIILYIKFWTF